jgi:glycerophosphoryl diester phosphodiesterase
LRRDWVVARPIAHRGLHDVRAGVVENSFAAVRAAIAAGFAIECDVRASRDGEAFVFHDDDLQRLTGQPGRFGDLDAASARALRLADGSSVPTLADVLSETGDATPLIVEIKSAFDGDMRAADRAAQLAERFARVALKSFDPDVIAHLRMRGCGAPLGIVAQADYDEPEWSRLSPEHKSELASLAHWRRTRPDFLSWRVDDLPHAGPVLAREALDVPVMTWTVRTPGQWTRAGAWADQAIFEGAAR